MSQKHSTILRLGRFVSPDLNPAKAAEPARAETPTALVAEAVKETADAIKVVTPNAAGDFPPKSMLGIVTYCYAKDVCGSWDIERKLRSSEEVRQARHGDIPDAKAIRRFRRLNRPALQMALEKALRFIRRAMMRRTLSQTVHGEKNPVPPTFTNLCAPGEETTVMVRREATQKLEVASMLDATLDD
jgi:hypothetical protein